MILEGEGMAPIARPSEAQVRDLVTSLASPKPGFASLTDEAGNYLQVAGGRPWCVVERREVSPLRHWRAHTESGRRPYEDGAKIRSGAGEIALRADEWLLLKQAAELFATFLAGRAFPIFVQWRSMNSTLGLPQ
ncbi:hypothetical protein [Sphingomonas psychrotolerans]|uniref:Uncharacterized protein n=1 Tax=Sphingomonas psychrotolerans TaxID=1327635 RepID=A0A2K8MFD9_9SPHN|nr:hypothetical protein [Sphingomonas psychrotolerans]ATY31684.1 hypothetical protein CVN68_06640 [Sphingomonas psychrotolerans]